MPALCLGARSVPETTNRMCSALELDVQAYAIAAVVQFHDVGDVSNIVVNNIFCGF